MIKNIIVKHLHILNQISTNKIFDNNPTNKIYCLNLAAYNLAAYNLAAYKIKSTNKTFIPYNHFKGSKKAFSYKSYKSIKVMRFWLLPILKCFKRGINKIFRLKIYKYISNKTVLLISTIKIREIIMDFNKIILKMILISSFDWSKIKVELYLTNLLKIEVAMRFGVYLNLISD